MEKNVQEVKREIKPVPSGGIMKGRKERGGTVMEGLDRGNKATPIRVLPGHLSEEPPGFHSRDHRGVTEEVFRLISSHLFRVVKRGISLTMSAGSPVLL